VSEEPPVKKATVNDSDDSSADIPRIKANSKGKAKEIDTSSTKNNEAVNPRRSQRGTKDTKMEQSSDESDHTQGKAPLKKGQLAAPSRSRAYCRASDAMKAGVSPQEDDLRKLRKYMGGDFMTSWKRKTAKFDKKYGKKKQKTKKPIVIPSDSSSSASSSESDSESSTPSPRRHGHPSSSKKPKREQYDKPSINMLLTFDEVRMILDYREGKVKR
jgi:hypothetical protein